MKTQLNIKLTGGLEPVIHKVKGAKVELKFFPFYEFFSVKDKVGFTIYEYSTGTRVSWGDTLSAAVVAAEDKLKNVSISQMDATIKAKGVINE